MNQVIFPLNPPLKHTSELFKSSKMLNVDKINIFNAAVFMSKIQGKSARSIFLPKFRKLSKSYPTRFSHLNYIIPIPKLNQFRCGTSYKRQFIWNNFLSTTEK